MKLNDQEIIAVATQVAMRLDDTDKLTPTLALCDAITLIGQYIADARDAIEQEYKNQNDCTNTINCADCVNDSFCDLHLDF